MIALENMSKRSCGQQLRSASTQRSPPSVKRCTLPCQGGLLVGLYLLTRSQQEMLHTLWKPESSLKIVSMTNTQSQTLIIGKQLQISDLILIADPDHIELERPEAQNRSGVFLLITGRCTAADRCAPVHAEAFTFLTLLPNL